MTCVVLFSVLWLVAGCVVVDRTTVREETVEYAPPVVRKVALSNGVTVLLAPRAGTEVVSARVFVRTGSMNEGALLGSGVSHVLEHLVSGGTTSKRTEAEYKRLLARIGGQSNASTSAFVTTYHINTGSEHLGDALAILAEWLSEAAITQDEFDREMQVVNRELQRGRNNPDRRLYRLASETVFRNHPARLPVIGYADQLNALTRDDVAQYYHERYVGANMTVVLAGDFNPAQALPVVRKAFGEVPAGSPVIDNFPREPRPVLRRVAEREMVTARQVRFRMDFRTVDLFHEDLFGLDVLSSILSHGRNSRLVKRLQREKRLVHSVRSFSYTPHYDGGVFGITVQCTRENLDAAREEIRSELRAIERDGVTEEEIQRAIAQVTFSFVKGIETVEGLASHVGWNELTTGDARFGVYYLAGLSRVTSGEVQRVVRTWFAPARECLAIIAPKGSKPFEPIEAPAPQGAQAATMRKVVLDNGLTLVVGRNAGAHNVVAVQAYSMAGLRAETPETNGLNMLTAKLLTAGTDTMSSDDIADAFESVGASISSTGGQFTLYLTTSVMPKHLARVLPVFYDCFFQSSFPEGELERERGQLLAAIRAREERAVSVASNEWRSRYFQRSPYGMDSGGTKESVSSFTREDALAWHRRFVVPSNVVVAVIGDIDVASVIEEARAVFSKAAPGEATLGDIAVDTAPEAPAEVRLTWKFSEAVLFMGFPGTSLLDVEDRYPLMVLDALLSGYEYPAGRLHDALRGEKEGYVYAVHAFNFFAIEPGYFGIYAMLDPARVEEALDIVKLEIEKVLGRPISEEELARAKAAVSMSVRFDRQQSSSVGLTVATCELYGLGYDFFADEKDRIEAVTVDDVKRVAKKYLVNGLSVIMIPEKKDKEASSDE